jgi:lysophospholipase L1-like esterase
MLLAPVLFLQGTWVRRTVPVLPEAPGERRGEIGDGPPLSLLVTGDSAAAGVGAPHQDLALVGQIVARLAPHYRVTWDVQAKSGDKTIDTLARLEALDPRPFDVAVTSLGVNDAIAMTTRRDWRKRQARLRDLLRDKFQVSQVVISSLPPMHKFPSLPQPLRWHIGRRATELNKDLEIDVATETGCHFVDLRSTADMSLMATDGFHPGPGVYAEWARRVAAIVLDS